MRSNAVWRLRLVALLMFFGGLSLLTKLFFVTVVRGEYYADEATLQVTGDKSLFNRGSIFLVRKWQSRVGGNFAKRLYVGN